MRHRKNRRFRHHSNGGRQHHLRIHNGENQSRLGSVSLSNDRIRNNTIAPQSAEKLVEKYNTLAKEALSSGDKSLSENYYQHADHYARILEEKVLSQKQNRLQSNEEPKAVEAKPSENTTVTQNQIAEEKK